MLPRPFRRQIDPHTEAIDDFVREGIRFIREGERVLDTGTGKGRFPRLFSSAQYVGMDLAVGNVFWGYSTIDVNADLLAFPFEFVTGPFLWD
jgi:hypothetical protein